MSWITRRQTIVNEIREVIAQAKLKDLEIDDEKFIIEISLKYSCSRRTALDYLKSARLKRIRYLR